jgi:hypothetical protein
MDQVNVTSAISKFLILQYRETLMAELLGFSVINNLG